MKRKRKKTKTNPKSTDNATNKHSFQIYIYKLQTIMWKKISTSLVVRKMSIKTILRFYFTQVRMASIKNTKLDGGTCLVWFSSKMSPPKSCV